LGKNVYVFFFLVFFSDKGLLAVAQLFSPDAMFKVVINLEMTKTHFMSKLRTITLHWQRPLDICNYWRQPSK